MNSYLKALDCTAPALVTDNWDCTVLIPDPLPSIGVLKKDRHNHTQKETLIKLKKKAYLETFVRIIKKFPTLCWTCKTALFENIR